MTTSLDKIRMEFESIKAEYQEAIADGKLSFGDAFNLLLHGVFSISKLLSQYAELDFEKRKALGVDLAQEFYDEVIKPIDLPIPNWIEGQVDKMLGLAVRPIVESIYDTIDEMIYKKLD